MGVPIIPDHARRTAARTQGRHCHARRGWPAARVRAADLRHGYRAERPTLTTRMPSFSETTRTVVPVLGTSTLYQPGW